MLSRNRKREKKKGKGKESSGNRARDTVSCCASGERSNFSCRGRDYHDEETDVVCDFYFKDERSN